jgi:hypothetical protein
VAVLCQRPALWREIRLRSTGTAERRNRIKPAELLTIEIDLPPLEEQRRLVELQRAVMRAERELAALRGVAAAAREEVLASRDADAADDDVD